MEIVWPGAKEIFLLALCHGDHKALCHGKVMALRDVEAKRIASAWKVYLFEVTPLIRHGDNLGKRWVYNDVW